MSRCRPYPWLTLAGAALFLASVANAGPLQDTCAATLPPLLARTTVEMARTLGELAVGAGAEEVLGAPETRRYLSLSARACQCRAAASSSIANQLDEKRQSVLSHRHGGRSAAVQAAILAAGAEEARNQSAGTALELFCRIAEAEARWDFYKQSLAVLDGALARTRELIRQKLRAQSEFDELQQQRLELQEQGVQLRANLERLNSELTHLLGLENAKDSPWFWPELEAIELSPLPHAEEALREGLQQRPQLELLRWLPGQVDAQTLPGMRQLLALSNGLLGMESQPHRALLLLAMLQRVCSQSEVSAVQRQLQEQYHEREQAVTREILQALTAAEAARQRVVLTRERSRILKARAADIEAREPKGLTTFRDVTVAKLDWLRASGDSVKAAADLLVARAQLRQATGQLGRECGSCAALPEAGPVQLPSPNLP